MVNTANSVLYAYVRVFVPLAIRDLLADLEGFGLRLASAVDQLLPRLVPNIH